LFVAFVFFIPVWNRDCFIVACIIVSIVLLLCYHYNYCFYSGTSLTLLRSVLHLYVCLCRNELVGQGQGQGYITTNSQSVSKSWCLAQSRTIDQSLLSP
jgi:hypothetical protein